MTHVIGMTGVLTLVTYEKCVFKISLMESLIAIGYTVPPSG